MPRQREPRVRDGEYMGFIAHLPCVACAVEGRATLGVEVAHVKLAIAAHGWRGWGLSERSDDRKSLPLCPAHHRTGRGAQHGVGERKFWDRLGICPACLCEALNAAYDAGQSGIPVIRDAVRARRTDGEPTC